MRKTFAVRRQSVFLVARHFAEGPRMTVRLAIGQKHRIITEALFAARRPDQNAVDPRLEFFEMSVRPGDAQSRDEMGATLARCGGAALVELLEEELAVCRVRLNFYLQRELAHGERGEAAAEQ